MFLRYAVFSVPVLLFVLLLLIKFDLYSLDYSLSCYMFRQFSATIRHNLNKMTNFEIFVLNCNLLRYPIMLYYYKYQPQFS